MAAHASPVRSLIFAIVLAAGPGLTFWTDSAGVWAFKLGKKNNYSLEVTREQEEAVKNAAAEAARAKAGKSDEGDEDAIDVDMEESEIAARKAAIQAKQSDKTDSGSTEPEAIEAAAGSSKTAKTTRTAETPAAEQAKYSVRTDTSGAFSYIIPEGWRSFTLPMQPHDVLSYDKKEGGLAITITFVEAARGLGLEKFKNDSLREAEEALKNFKKVQDEQIVLPSGLHCIKVLSLGDTGDKDNTYRRMQYFFAPRRHLCLVATLTVAKSLGDKYDKVLLHIVNSVATDKAH